MTKNKNKITLKETFKLNYKGFKIINKYCPGMFLSDFLHAAVSSVVPYVGIYLSALIINELAGSCDPQKLANLVIITLITTAALSVLQGILSRWRNYKRANHWHRFKKIYSDKMLSMDYEDLDSQKMQDLKSQIMQNDQWSGWGFCKITWMFENLVKSLFGILSAVILTVSLFTSSVPESAGAFTLLNNPLFILLIIGIILLTTFLAPAFTNKADSYWVKLSENMKMGNRFFGYFGFFAFESDRALDIRIYEQNKLAFDYIKTEGAYTKDSMGAVFARGPQGIFHALSGAVSKLSLFFIYLFVCLKAWAGAFGVGSVTQYVGAVTSLSGNISMLVQFIGSMKNNTPFMRTVFEYLDKENNMYKGSLTTEKRSDRKYNVEFRNVSFKYPGSEVYALKNVSVKFEVGKRLAVVGMNGSGKTTFIKLLCRLYDPEEGEILLNGIDIKKYNYDDYMKVFSVVFQDYKLLARPIAENVAASLNYDSERVIDSLNKAGFTERLKDMPKGIDTFLYKNWDKEGVEVSGGEAQKIAIARALYKDSPFIILDEPTAALDPIAEAEIYSKFNDIAGDKTAIYISHRLSSCKFCDEILVFDKGKVIEKGSHEGLLENKNGKYFELWNAQAQYYV